VVASKAFGQNTLMLCRKKMSIPFRSDVT